MHPPWSPFIPHAPHRLDTLNNSVWQRAERIDELLKTTKQNTEIVRECVDTP